MRALSRIDRTTTPKQVVDRIVLAIQHGELQPGERLPIEPELAAALGVGRNSLREAIRFLELAGVLDVRRGEGTFVVPDDTTVLSKAFSLRIGLTPQSARQVIESRLVLESAVAGFAATRAREEDLSRMSRSLELMRSALDDQAFLRADISFHEHITDASHNVVLRHLVDVLRTCMGQWIETVVRLQGSREAACRQHAELLDAVRRHDVAAARAAMEAHIADVAQRLLIVIETSESHAANA